jgi:F-type H+-transporting ATPase subunit delta
MKLLPKQYGKVLYELTKDAKGDEMDKIIEQFILFLVREQALSKINYIIDEFVDYAKEQTGISQLKITSARKLSKSEIEKITECFGKKVEAQMDIDESILGGVVIKEKNRILDASVKTQLKKLERQLS